MNKNINLAFCLFALFSLVGCSTSGHYESKASTLSNNYAETDRFIIKSANLEIRVDTPQKTLEEIRELVKTESGFIDSVYDNDQKNISMNVKIPESKLEIFVDEVSKRGELISKSISSRDVTEEIVDIDAKLKNMRALRDRLRELLDKAKDVSEILEIEKELSKTQSEIDSIEGRRKSLKQQVAFSNVDITISQNTIYGPIGYIGIGIYWVIEKLFVIK